MHHFTFPQEFDGIAYVRVVDEAEQIVIGHSCFLFCRQILIQIREHITLDADILHVKGHARRRNRINSGSVIHKVNIKSGFFDFFLTQIAGQLVNNGSDHLKVCQFFSSVGMGMTAHGKILQFCRNCDILVTESRIRRKNMFQDKTVAVTGGAHGIGKCIAEQFRANGARVYVIDRADGDHFYIGDIAEKVTMEDFAAQVIEREGKIDVLVNNALPLMRGIDSCTYEEFQYALAVGVTAPFYLSKLFAPHFTPGGSIINISSSRDRMSQPQTESYTAAKGGIAALTHAMAVSFSGKIRVNSISPGWIDTAYTVYEGPDASQQPAGRVGNPMDIANMVLYLASDKAGFITGENICIDGGMTKLMIYHNDCGWKLEI